MTFYTGPLPKSCDCCGASLAELFYDKRMPCGRWANVCWGCFSLESDGRLGTGQGQKYRKQPDGRFRKVDG